MPAKKPKPQPAGPKALRGSAEAKRKAAVILEAFSGLRTTQSASDELGIALVRYYVLETRMLQAMIDALEPRSRGRKVSEEREREKLQDEVKNLQREVRRLQAMYRTMQRAVGVQASAKRSKKAKGSKTRRARTKTRGERVLDVLRSDVESSSAAGGAALGSSRETSDANGPTEQGSRARE